jgi:hypothetical protein
MKINWKRIVFAAIWSVLLIHVLLLLITYLTVISHIWLPAHAAMPYSFSFVKTHTNYSPKLQILITLEPYILFFLGGLWVARKIDSRFILHGLLVGIFANVLFAIILALLFVFLNVSLALLRPVTVRPFDLTALRITAFRVIALRTIVAMVGAYVGGKWRTKLQREQIGALPH